MDRLFVVGTSAGGVSALRELSAGLPADFNAALLVVLHVGASHSLLPTLMSVGCPLDVAHAVDGEPIVGGRIRVAPPDHHLIVEGDRLRLARGPKENFCRPAVDPLFVSAALAHGDAVVGTILTGRLDDGTAGLQAVKRCGGTTVVQDPTGAYEPSMPRSALQYVGVDHCVPLASMPALFVALASPTKDRRRPGLAADAEALGHEHRLTLAEGNAMENLQRVGRPSTYVCPDCQGGLSEILDSRPKRFRCHTGHAFTSRSLQHALAATSDEAVWNALRALQEKQLLLEEMAATSRVAADGPGAHEFDVAAATVSRQVTLMRQLVELAPAPIE